MNNGWIKIHRKLLEWEWYDEPNTFRLFMHLLLKANHKPKNYRGVFIESGQVMTGINLLSEQTGLTFQKVRTSLNNLKSTNEITIKTNNKGTIIQIVKYKDYQVSTSEITNEQQTNNKPITTNKKEKKEKKEDTPKKIFIPPTEQEFRKEAYDKIVQSYGKDTFNQKVKGNVIAKYHAWNNNDWKDGYNKPIKNWKAKVNHSLKHFLE